MTANNQFLTALDESESRLKQLGLRRTNVDTKGYATYVEYSGSNISVLFMHGPSDWHVDMVVTIREQRFEIKDLFQIPEIANWANKNKLLSLSTNPLNSEVIWGIGLLELALRLIK